ANVFLQPLSRTARDDPRPPDQTACMPSRSAAMKHIPHHRTHWIAVAVALAFGLLVLEASGQQPTNNMSPNAQAVFQGRPALAGAQAGLGAQSGPAQGGIGLQGSDGAGRNLRAPQ